MSFLIGCLCLVPHMHWLSVRDLFDRAISWVLHCFLVSPIWFVRYYVVPIGSMLGLWCNNIRLFFKNFISHQLIEWACISFRKIWTNILESFLLLRVLYYWIITFRCISYSRYFTHLCIVNILAMVLISIYLDFVRF